MLSIYIYAYCMLYTSDIRCVFSIRCMYCTHLCLDSNKTKASLVIYMKLGEYRANVQYMIRCNDASMPLYIINVQVELRFSHECTQTIALTISNMESNNGLLHATRPAVGILYAQWTCLKSGCKLWNKSQKKTLKGWKMGIKLWI